jgi:hypothetical protein
VELQTNIYKKCSNFDSLDRELERHRFDMARQGPRFGVCDVVVVVFVIGTRPMTCVGMGAPADDSLAGDNVRSDRTSSLIWLGSWSAEVRHGTTHQPSECFIREAAAPVPWPWDVALAFSSRKTAWFSRIRRAWMEDMQRNSDRQMWPSPLEHRTVDLLQFVCGRYDAHAIHPPIHGVIVHLLPRSVRWRSTHCSAARWKHYRVQLFSGMA